MTTEKARLFTLKQNRYLWAVSVFNKNKHAHSWQIKGRRKDGSIRKRAPK